MNSRTELKPTPFPFRLKKTEKILCIGSCFSEMVAERLDYFKFDVLSNPFGILFHPKAISKAIQRIYTSELYVEEELFKYNELFFSWDLHSSFNNPVAKNVLHQINDNIAKSIEQLRAAKCVILTYGTAWVYDLTDLDITVANCHKVPQKKFNKRLLSSSEIRTAMELSCQMLLEINPHINILLAVSPVRHSKEGLVNNNRSKARLIDAAHDLADKSNAVHYFPSYELIIDDLRDYRYMKADLVHPTEVAENYVWEFFKENLIDPNDFEQLTVANKIQKQLDHKIQFPNTIAGKQFIYSIVKQIREYQQKFSCKDFESELNGLIKNLSA